MVSVISSCLVEAQCDTIGMAKDRDPLNLLQTQVFPALPLSAELGLIPMWGQTDIPMAPLELGALEPELVWLMEPLLALLLSGWLGECGSTGIAVWSSRRAQINKSALLNSSEHQ